MGHTCKVPVSQEFFFPKKHEKGNQNWMITHFLASLLSRFLDCFALTAKFSFLMKIKVWRMFTKTQQICLFTAFCAIKTGIFLLDLSIRDQWLFSYLHESWRYSVVEEQQCRYNIQCFVCILVNYGLCLSSKKPES